VIHESMSLKYPLHPNRRSNTPESSLVVRAARLRMTNRGRARLRMENVAQTRLGMENIARARLRTQRAGRARLGTTNVAWARLGMERGGRLAGRGRSRTWRGARFDSICPSTLEATQGQILSQSPIYTTRIWWHLYGS